MLKKYYDYCYLLALQNTQLCNVDLRISRERTLCFNIIGHVLKFNICTLNQCFDFHYLRVFVIIIFSLILESYNQISMINWKKYIFITIVCQKKSKFLLTYIYIHY
jgi:hypothetical protein